MRLRKYAVTGSAVSAANTVFKKQHMYRQLNHVGTASRKQEFHKLPQFRMPVGPCRKSAFSCRISLIVFPFSVRHFFFPAFAHPATTAKLPVQSRVPKNSTAFKIIGIAASNVAGALLVR